MSSKFYKLDFSSEVDLPPVHREEEMKEKPDFVVITDGLAIIGTACFRHREWVIALMKYYYGCHDYDYRDYDYRDYDYRDYDYRYPKRTDKAGVPISYSFSCPCCVDLKDRQTKQR